MAQKNLKILIKNMKKRYTQKEIAKNLGISQSYVSMLLSGQKNNAKTLKRIEDAIA